MKKNKTSKYNIYYFANMAAQFLQIIPIYNKIGGYFITAYPFFETWIKMNLKFGLGSTKFVFKREEIADAPLLASIVGLRIRLLCFLELPTVQTSPST